MRNCPIGDEGPATRPRRVHVFWDLTQRRTSIILFLLIAVPALTILSLSLDPFEGMDESEHFERSVQLSEGRIFPVRSPRGIGAGDYFEPRVTEFVHSYGRHNAEAAVGGRSGGAGIEEASQDGRKFAYFSNTVIYFPTAHAAPAIATYVLARAG